MNLTRLLPGLPAVLGFLLVSSVFAASAAGPTDGTTEEILRLRAEIRHHDELYFRKAAPEIGDPEYDRLKRRLAALESKAGVEQEKNPGAGDDRVPGMPRARHRERMTGLEKSYTREQLLGFLHRIAARLPGRTPVFVVEPKYDGLAISVTYERGVLKRAVTRGDGDEGDDVTAAVLALTGVPRALKADTAPGTGAAIPAMIEIRGEIYMSRAEFERINRQREAAGEEPYANPRNLAVGTLKSTTTETRGDRRLEIVFYGFGALDNGAAKPESQRSFLAQLGAWGLPRCDSQVTLKPEVVWEAVEKLRRSREKLPYPVDGAVVKIDLIALREEIGDTGGNPGWAIACKFSPETAESRLLKIIFGIGRTGALTPIAEFEPVKLGGAMIRRASLHNADEIARRDIRIGDTLVIEKSGDIIPVVTGVNLERRNPSAIAFTFPTHCPCCKTALVRHAGEAPTSCPNRTCPERVRRAVEHFASREATGITGLGPALVEKLVNAGLVKSPADLYRLRVEALSAIPGMGEKSAGKLIAAIDRSKHAPPARFIIALGIPDIGPANARRLAGKFKSLREVADVRPEQLAGLNLGAAAERSLLNFFAVRENRAIAEELIALGCGQDPDGASENKNGPAGSGAVEKDATTAARVEA